MENKYKDDTRQFINVAWARDGDFIIAREPLLLACIMHTTGEGRDSQDFKDIQKIFKDHNLKD